VFESPQDDVFLCRVADVPYAEHGPAAVYPATKDMGTSA